MYKLLALAGLAILITGCGGSMVNVQGTVTLNGKPLPNVNVTYEDAVKQIRASGVTDAAGKYRLSTQTKDDGAPPGTYQVAVIQPGPADSSQTAPQARLFPEKYERIETSGLTKTVQSASNNYDIQLSQQ